MEFFEKYKYGSPSPSWLDSIVSPHDLEFFCFIFDDCFNSFHLNYSDKKRDYMINPTTDREDKYLGLEGFFKDYNTNTKEFIYPENLITRYLSSINDIERAINNLFDIKYQGEYLENLEYLACFIACRRYFVGSKVFVEIFRDLGKENLVSKELMKELSPVIDMYKHLNLVRFFNYNNKFDDACKQREEIKILMEKYPYLQEYYDKEIGEIKNNYKIIFLKICYYVYIIKQEGLYLINKYKAEKYKDEAVRYCNIIRMEGIIPDNDFIEVENEIIAKFLTIIKYGRFRSKTFYKIIGPYQDR